MEVAPSLDTLETAVAETLERAVREAHEQQLRGNASWTHHINLQLGRLGNSMGYEVCVKNQSGEFNAEWLYDMVWYEETGEGDDRRLVDVSLVLESEWEKSISQIRYDFEKLLVANARHRVLICQAAPINRESVLIYLLDAVKQYRLGRTGDRFLIALLDSWDEKFEFRLIVRE